MLRVDRGRANSLFRFVFFLIPVCRDTYERGERTL
jgi:hypothetical protein